jgi:hypothetical protein
MSDVRFAGGIVKAIKKLKTRGGFSQLLKKEVKEMKSSDRIRNN